MTSKKTGGKRTRSGRSSDSPPSEKSAGPTWDIDDRLTLTNLAQVAKALAISKRQVQDYMNQGCPGRASQRGKQNGHYYLPEIIEWCRENVWKPRVAFDEFGDPMAPAGEGSSPNLEEYRKWKAKLAELDFNERNGKLVEVSAINSVMIGVAQTIRIAGENIARAYGNGPVEILNEAMDEAEEQIREQFSRVEEIEDDEEDQETDDRDPEE